MPKPRATAAGPAYSNLLQPSRPRSGLLELNYGRRPADACAMRSTTDQAMSSPVPAQALRLAPSPSALDQNVGAVTNGTANAAKNRKTAARRCPQARACVATAAWMRLMLSSPEQAGSSANGRTSKMTAAANETPRLAP